MKSPSTASPQAAGLIEVNVTDIHQLFNSMDPSPFHERDMDPDAEQFILGWAQEHPIHAPLRLLVQLGSSSGDLQHVQAMLAESVHHYFRYRADMVHRDFRQLLREGRISLAIGVTFLALCELLAQSLPATSDTWHGVLRQGLTIIGWVAMWRPLEIYLYRWWPLRRLERIYRNLSEMQVEVRLGSPPSAPASKVPGSKE